MTSGNRFSVSHISALAALWMMGAAPEARADADFLSLNQGKFFCTLKSSATGSLGKPTGVAPPLPAESTAQRLQRTDQMLRDLEKKDASAKLAPLEARLSIVVRNGSAILDLRFANVPPQTSLQNLEINVAPTSSASPTVRRASGALPGHTVQATATATSFTVYWTEPETPDGPIYRQVHLTGAAGAIDFVIWVIDSNGRRGAGRACVMERS